MKQLARKPFGTGEGSRQRLASLLEDIVDEGEHLLDFRRETCPS